MRKQSVFAIVAMMLACGMPMAGLGQTAGAPGTVEAKLDQTLDTAYTKAGDKVSATLQGDVTLNDTKLTKGTRLTGTVIKAVKQDKKHPNAGLILRFDDAQPKGGAAVPLRATIVSISPSHSDEIEKVDVGSGDVTDASLAADVAAGTMDDANDTATAKSATAVNGVRVISNIKGVVLFAAAPGKASGIIVARKGALQLDKWTRLNVVLSPR
jgi:hypothetical protein